MTLRLAQELRHLAEFRTDLSAAGLPALRDSLNARRRESASALEWSDVDVVDEWVAGDDGPEVPIRVYRGGSSGAPAVLFCHSGAFVLGNLDTDHRQCLEWARRASCTVVSVDYRLAPEHPHPAGLDDALAVLEWIAAKGNPLDVDTDRLAVSGSSAGGAIAARLAQRAAAGTAPPIAFQLLHQPVLDDAPTPSKEEFLTTPGFDGPATRQMWRHVAGAEFVPPDAVPARADDLSGLAAALITCSELDPLRDEAVQYALRLMRSGVSTELHVFPGTCHGFDSLMPEWEVSQQLFALQGAALRRALHGAG
ncbi:alpha/beta hydrolase [Mycobacterium antarcticum]|uniref:alpha/beta hydrolase n=1 Tax=unclassified Mycolicibacterium TaxID=2636767 RepID=UPI00238209C6|nr:MULTISPECIES: alpha/beta hydrolase [unclassified Mycolicibacterium]BDX33095.1 alpha/beta hydrolase [Mycolicibacterium sp. TUM20985]GLP76269.1 alpha/beta hydrolase [Mycolicibacterium sp. TUM20983]GLP83351.1 alpha/beta hydrolase [Mycolicibacterium sp. TUM20984]